MGGNTIAKRCHQHSYEFQKLMSSWGVWVRFSFTGWLMDGWVDGTEYQKCPSIFFILCGYIDHVYVYLYIYSKNVTNILMGFKI